MTGIVSAGAYIPYYYLQRDTIGKAWNTKGQKGKRTIANADEDSLTMCVEAAVDCLRRVDRKDVTALYCATVSSPYVEKSNSVLVATVCDLANDVYTADFNSSLRSGTTAMRAALDAAANNKGVVLVTAADCRNAAPKSSSEQTFGDAGASIAIGSENVIAEFIASTSVSNEINDTWRNDGEDRIHITEQRFVTEEGYLRSMPVAVKNLLAKTGYTPDQITRFITTTATMKDHLKLAKLCGFKPDQIADTLMECVGDCGTAQPILLLNKALETAQAGDLLLLAAYGNGADAMLFKVTENINTKRPCKVVSRYFKRQAEFTEYARFLSFRSILTPVVGQPYDIPAAPVISWREQNVYLKLCASRCKKCGTWTFPPQRVCYTCRSLDEYEEIRRYDGIAKLNSWSCDRLAGRTDDPVVIQCIADDQDGCRLYLNMADFQEEEIHKDLVMEFTFRKIHNQAGFPNYYWKFRPARTLEED